MKRTMPWSGKEDDSSDKSSASESDDTAPAKAQSKVSEVKSGKRKSNVVDSDALRRHGYKGGPSVLKVPPLKESERQDWTWSTGKERREANKESEESYEESVETLILRQKTRTAIAQKEQLTTALARKDKKNLSFSQKEKRKRELGQASRGKNYVEEEKRLLRDSGVCSGFDT